MFLYRHKTGIVCLMKGVLRIGLYKVTGLSFLVVGEVIWLFIIKVCTSKLLNCQ